MTMTTRCAYCSWPTDKPVFCGEACAANHRAFDRVLLPGLPAELVDRVVGEARAAGVGVLPHWDRLINDALDRAEAGR